MDPVTLSDMSNRLHRLLMLWLLIALQAMAPFIHAHAGAVQLDHADWVHVHSPVSLDSPVVSTAEHEAEIMVAQGVPLRPAALSTVADASGGLTPSTQPIGASLGVPDMRFTAGSTRHFFPPDHDLPLALAPPFG